jgi:uncharacterized protein (DUF433 family)
MSRTGGTLTLPDFDRITFDPQIMGGRACIRGLRITVALVLNLLANGMEARQIVEEYPPLELEDIRQVLRYAARLAEDEIEFVTSRAA